MGDRSDILKSLFRSFAEGTGKRLGLPFANLAKMLRKAIEQASSVSEPQISKALTRVEGIAQASCVCRDGRIWIEATSMEGVPLSFSVKPLGARFAPRGAKELLFLVEPEEVVGKVLVRDLVGAIAALVAHTLWGPFLGRIHDPIYDAIAERDGSEVRVDLRSVPAVRGAHQRGLAQLFDVLELASMQVGDGVLHLELKLPPLFAP